LNSRTTDGFDTSVTYSAPVAEGTWQPAPGSAPLDPQWGNVTPFTLTSGNQFRNQLPGPPFSRPDKFPSDYQNIFINGQNETLGFGQRPEYGTFQAAFYANDLPGTETFPGFFLKIAVDIADRQKLALRETARLMALVALANADGMIAAWDAKYFFNDWRPIQAIRATAIPNSRITDPNWVSLIYPTPSYPDYVSAHATLAAATYVAITQFFNNPTLTLEIVSDSLPGVTATYSNPTDFVDDAVYSRYYGGVNWFTSCADGAQLGVTVGNWVVSHALLPL